MTPINVKAEINSRLNLWGVTISKHFSAQPYRTISNNTWDILTVPALDIREQLA